MSTLNWQKSTFSEGGGANCVYVAAHPTGRIYLQESDAPDTTLTTHPAAFAALIDTHSQGRRTGRIDRQEPSQRAATQFVQQPVGQFTEPPAAIRHGFPHPHRRR
ncbi:DUF397 domain-containing protein [Streptomyces sp. Je 1-369]|uniref:DUF397 domain-containing protein n=1 Tax=Streptomyces sp. Je 1-369 TaxID=2966192 RepID=UPI002AA2B407|nr:DUF397 domain-containing protein [Streptomyces sp. Je 1-369]